MAHVPLWHTTNPDGSVSALTAYGGRFDAVVPDTVVADTVVPDTEFDVCQNCGAKHVAKPVELLDGVVEEWAPSKSFGVVCVGNLLKEVSKGSFTDAPKITVGQRVRLPTPTRGRSE